MFVAFLLATTAATAAPKLRLSTAALGPFSIAQGANGNDQSLDAYNEGDGALSLSVSSSASWLSASTNGTRACGQPGGVCTAIKVSLQTSGLSRGTVTGFVTVSDPNALDAPQTIAVTVQIGGGVPDRMQFIVPPNNAPGAAGVHHQHALQRGGIRKWGSKAHGAWCRRRKFPRNLFL